MKSAQLRLLPDPQPLVERLGGDFFRNLPTDPGVYFLRDTANVVLYVGKAKNLRQRLRSYRVANPDTMPRRRLRLLHLARTIEWQVCIDEAAARARERELLLALKPKFNRAGVWPATPRMLAWRVREQAIQLAIVTGHSEAWDGFSPPGTGIPWLRVTLVRLLWYSLYPERGLAVMPAGWFQGRLPEIVQLRLSDSTHPARSNFSPILRALLTGELADWVARIDSLLKSTPRPFDRAVLTEDLEYLEEFVCQHPNALRPVGFETSPLQVEK